MPYFFKYPNEEPFAIDSERQADLMIRNTSRWQRQGLQYLGKSNGIVFQKVMLEKQKEINLLKSDISEIQKDINKFEKTKDKFIFDDLLGEDDEKVMKVKSLIKEKEELIYKKKKELEKAIKEIKTKAFDAELKEALKNTKPPRNMEKEYAVNEVNLSDNSIIK